MLKTSPTAMMVNVSASLGPMDSDCTEPLAASDRPQSCRELRVLPAEVRRDGLSTPTRAAYSKPLQCASGKALVAVKRSVKPIHLGMQQGYRLNRYLWGMGKMRRRLLCKRCGREDSNLHGVLAPPGPKPGASANSATPARCKVLCWICECPWQDSNLHGLAATAT